MKLYSKSGNKLQSVTKESFKLEKDIQNLIENNLDEIFGLEFVKSEFGIQGFRFDTLCFDNESNSFVIIEYKKGSSYSVIDQGYTYLSVLLNNKSDFILEFNELKDKYLKRDEIDWSQSRVIFISPKFTDYQKNSVNFKNVPFELWEITNFDNNHIGLTQISSNSEVDISSTIPLDESKPNVVKQVSYEVKVYSEDYLINKSVNRPDWIIEKYNDLRQRIMDLGDVVIKPNGKYLSFRNKRPFVDIVFYNSGIYTILNMKEGTLNDPNNLMKSFNGKGHWGNGDYHVTIDQNTDLNYLMFLIKQSFDDKL